MNAPLELLNYTFLGNTLLDWLLAAAGFGVTFLVMPVVRGRLQALRLRHPHMEHPALELLALLAARTSRLVLLLAAFYFAERLLTLPARIDRVFDVIIVFGAWFQAAIWASTALRFFIQLRQRRSGLNDEAAKSSVNVLMFVAQLVIWALFVLLALDNLGVNITALVAGMGVGGIAIALAVQTILSDVFGSLSIAFDKPFVVGDTLRIDDIEGRVEHIGIKSTRLRSVTGEQVILANADVLKSRVRNLGRMTEKRVNFRLRVGWDTPPADVAKIPQLAKDAVAAQEQTRFVSCLLNELGEYALEFEVIYFVQNPGEIRTPLVVDAVNRGIVEGFAAAGIAFAYPTRRQIG
jgi:small-conductance mechanosensitive channel